MSGRAVTLDHPVQHTEAVLRILKAKLQVPDGVAGEDVDAEHRIYFVQVDGEVGISVSLLSLIERGEHEPKPELVAEMVEKQRRST